MRNAGLTFILALISLSAGAQPGASLGVARLIQGEALLSSFDTNAPKAMHPCQPIKGEKVEMLESKKVPGGELVRVRVLSGSCKGQEGWVGQRRLEAAP